MAECWVYKAFYCAQPDKLLYVGISDTPSDRMTQHGRDKWWWHLVERIEWFKVDSRETAALIESEIISAEKPLFNKHQSTLTAGAVLCGCLELLEYTFNHCPLCHSACRYSKVDWEIKFLCTADVGGGLDAKCFEVRMQCGAHRHHVEWTQLVPITVLLHCKTKMPKSVLDDLWSKADSNGEISEDIPELRPPTLADLFCSLRESIATHPHLLIEAQ